MYYPASEVKLVFFNANQVLAVYHRGTIVEAWRLYNVISNKPLFIQITIVPIAGVDCVEIQPFTSLDPFTGEPSKLDYTKFSEPIEFNSTDFGDLWNDEENIIVGTGDIRNITYGGNIYKNNIKGHKLILTSPSSFVLELFYENNNPCTTINIPSSVIQN